MTSCLCAQLMLESEKAELEAHEAEEGVEEAEGGVVAEVVEAEEEVAVRDHPAIKDRAGKNQMCFNICFSFWSESRMSHLLL